VATPGRQPDLLGQRVIAFGSIEVAVLDEARSGAEVIHGNETQGARQRALANFKTVASRALVATDVAARGGDFDHVSHLVNYDVPHEPESYVHRIGRLSRAGAAGVALSFCDREERERICEIERLIKPSCVSLRSIHS
jgi:ATP-dependent RNA helicase RhlE